MGRALEKQPLVVLCLLFLVALASAVMDASVPRDQAVERQSARSNRWSANSSTGRTFAGTWTVVADPTTGTVTGTWTLDGADGRPVARGGWSAAKSPTRWTGTWRANVSGSRSEYTGTWSADVDLKPDAQFADLFKMAAKSVVSGNWRAGGQSGAWSIRVFD